MTQKLFSVWEGVYTSFVEAGGDLDAFDSDIWIDKQKCKVQIALESYQDNNTISKDYPLPTVIAMLLSQQDKLRVLDFGGGMGLQYLDIISKVPEAKGRLEYYVVDGKASIANRPSALNQFINLHFCSELDDLNIKADIIHIGSTLQYIEDWKGLLQSLVDKFKPKYFVFSDLAVGDIKTFITHQVFYEKRIPVRMMNVIEFINILTKLSFCLMYKTYFETTILGHNELPNHSLPKDYRIKHSLNMVFKVY